MLKIKKIPDELSVCRLDKSSSIPAWVLKSNFFSITKTEDELSVVCDSSLVPSDIICEDGWRMFKVLGPLDFSLTGILSSILLPLAEQEISIFALSTYDTDYILVKSSNLKKASSILSDFFEITS